ncbi:MAG: ribosomal L7Ae/L30e/S12e/Gadd45 family protein [Nanoarchaeota archaeon]|nr:ribosomal L7Ae/L30e/S12e/Gadd45 family protein [Nanoarchaeota archaeon]
MIENLQKELKENKLVFGTKESLKAIKTGKAKEVFLAKNIDEEVKEEVEKYAKIEGIKVNILEKDNVELGALCKKPFSISVLCY